MVSKAKNLIKGNLWKNIFLFSLPLVASNLLQVLFNMSDIAIVGNFASDGDTALGSVGSTSTIVTLFTGFLIGIGGGINVVIATCFGAGDKKGVEKSVHTSAFLAPVIGLILTLIGMIGVRPLLEILDTKEELIAGAELYLRIYFIGMPAVAIYNFGNGLYSAVGNTKKPLIILFISGILNIALNLFFVIVCRLDVAGVALASIISQYLSAFLILFSLFRSNDIFCLRLSRLKPDKDKTKQVLVLGVPAGLQNIIFAIANLFIQKAVNSFDHVTVEGIVAAQNADPLIYDVLAAFYMACSSFIGQSFGQRNKKKILHSYFISLLYSFALGAFLGLGLAKFYRVFLGIFTSSDRSGKISPSGNGRFLHGFRLYGLHHRRLARARQNRDPDNLRDPGVLRFPHRLDLHRFPSFRDPYLTFPSLQFFLDDHRDLRSDLFLYRLPENHERFPLTPRRTGRNRIQGFRINKKRYIAL